MAGGGLQKVKSDGRWEVEERDEVKQTDGVFHEDSEGAQRLRLATRGRTPATPCRRDQTTSTQTRPPPPQAPRRGALPARGYQVQAWQRERVFSHLEVEPDMGET